MTPKNSNIPTMGENATTQITHHGILEKKTIFPNNKNMPAIKGHITNLKSRKKFNHCPRP